MAELPSPFAGAGICSEASALFDADATGYWCKPAGGVAGGLVWACFAVIGTLYTHVRLLL